MKRHCIVTPDMIGPIHNGGIGTACYHLARFLRQTCGDQVDVLFTSSFEKGTPAAWRDHYRATYDIGFVGLDELPDVPYQPVHEGRWNQMVSLRIHQWLRMQGYDQIHFQEWKGNGFVATQAKRTGQAYQDTLLTCTLHSSSEWVREGSHQFSMGGADDLQADYCERYSAAQADVAVCPSPHMREWVLSRGWRLPDDTRVIPYLMSDEPVAGRSVGKVEELCFFGRLETRKGLEMYLSALDLLAREVKPENLPKLSFLGKPGENDPRAPALAVLEDRAKRLGFPFHILTDFDSASSLAYIAGRPNLVVLICSLLDNLPFTVYECLQRGTPILASRTGGIPEMIAEEGHLFDPNPKALAARLARLLREGLPALPACGLAAQARRQWREVRDGTSPRIDVRQPVAPADVTLCIPHFNYGRYLPELLDSLDAQTAPGFSLVLVDDGSTDPASTAAFAELGRSRSRANWRFLTKANGGIGETRNFAASQATTPYLLFMDADNVAEPVMVERFISGMTRFDGDALGCYLRKFEDGSDRHAPKIIASYAPMGPCLDAGILNNIFGDANMLISRDAFQEVGGFELDRNSSYEDWEFLAKLALKGKRQDVIPEYLFLYRVTGEGFSRNTSLYLNYKRVLRPFRQHLPGWAGRAVDMLQGLNFRKAALERENLALRQMLLESANRTRQLEAAVAKMRQRVP